MIGFDANMLSLLLRPESKAPVDPVTKQEIEGVAKRSASLVAQLDATEERILIPTPVLTEFLVLVREAAPEYLAKIHKLPRFVIREFNERAAVELAAGIRKALDQRGSLDKDLDSRIKRDFVEATWAKVTFDRQIVAIAKVEPVSALYSTDGDVHAFAKVMGVPCKHLADIPLPPENPQMELDLKNQTSVETGSSKPEPDPKS
jgi:predicted nucleic acid-binding protein